MNTKTESATIVYGSKDVPVALIKRDEITKKNLVYMMREATVEQISGLINHHNESD